MCLDKFVIGLCYAFTGPSGPILIESMFLELQWARGTADPYMNPAIGFEDGDKESLEIITEDKDGTSICPILYLALRFTMIS